MWPSGIRDAHIITMHVVGSIIARLGSKRLRYKNLLPFLGECLIGIGIKKLKAAHLVNEVVVSTESELVGRIAYSYGAKVLKRPQELAEDNVPSIPVFQHITQHYPCDIHVNYNINLPLCHVDVINRGIEIAAEKGESLSVPYAVWAQRSDILDSYEDPWNITAHRFNDERAGDIDVHTEDDLLECYRSAQNDAEIWDKGALLVTKP